MENPCTTFPSVGHDHRSLRAGAGGLLLLTAFFLAIKDVDDDLPVFCDVVGFVRDIAALPPPGVDFVVVLAAMRDSAGFNRNRWPG